MTSENTNTYRRGLKHSGVMAVCMAVQVIFGLLPNIVIAKKLGLGYATDVYLMAFAINQIIVKFSRIGTLPKIFIMVLSDDFIKDRRKTETKINNFLNIFFFLSLVVVVLSYCAAPFLVNVIAKGFDAEKRAMTMNIFRFLTPLLLCQCLTALLESVFKLNNKFNQWAILSIIPPVIIAIFVFLFIRKLGIYSMVYGALLAHFSHLLLLLYFIFVRFKYSYKFLIDMKCCLFHKIFNLMAPFYLSSVPVQIMLGLQSYFVSMLPLGFTSVFFYARRIVDYVEQFSINILSQLMLPYFTKKIAQQSLEHIKGLYGQLLCIINYTHLPVLVILIVLGPQIVNLLFASRLTSAEIISTFGATFSFLLLFFIPEPANDFQINIILGMKRTMWINMVNIFRMFCVIVLSVVLFKYFKFWGIIFSYSLTHLQSFLINQWHLRKRYGFENIFKNSGFIRIIFLNLILALFCFSFNYAIHANFQLVFFHQKFAVAGIVFAVSLLFYIFISFISKNRELSLLLNTIRNR